jgi:hypothetical protein
MSFGSLGLVEGVGLQDFAGSCGAPGRSESSAHDGAHSALTVGGAARGDAAPDGLRRLAGGQPPLRVPPGAPSRPKRSARYWCTTDNAPHARSAVAAPYACTTDDAPPCPTPPSERLSGCDLCSCSLTMKPLASSERRCGAWPRWRPWPACTPMASSTRSRSSSVCSSKESLRLLWHNRLAPGSMIKVDIAFERYWKLVAAAHGNTRLGRDRGVQGGTEGTGQESRQVCRGYRGYRGVQLQGTGGNHRDHLWLIEICTGNPRSAARQAGPRRRPHTRGHPFPRTRHAPHRSEDILQKVQVPPTFGNGGQAGRIYKM